MYETNDSLMVVMSAPACLFYHTIISRTSVNDNSMCYLTGAVFNLLCDDRDNMLMTKIERHFNSQVAEVNIRARIADMV